MEQTQRAWKKNPDIHYWQILGKDAKNTEWGKDSLFNKWCWENWIFTCKRIKPHPYCTPFVKIKSKWIKNVNVKPEISPSWCTSVDWAPACEPKGRRFDSQSGHMRGLWARSPVGGVQEAITHRCFSPSLSPSLPLSLKINKILKKEKPETIQLLKEDLGKELFDIGLGKKFWIWYEKHKQQNKNTWDYIKLSLLHSKEAINRMKRQPMK